ncbi:type IV toxin-antitoxin system AbiEi family antitoxin domain-containing protein [Nocardioides zeae]
MILSTWQCRPLLDSSFPMPLDRPFHRHEAVAEGVSPRWLSALVASGHLRRTLRGVYVAAQVPDDVGSRIASLRLVVPDDAVICDRHAGWLHGADMVLAPGEHLESQPIRVFRSPGAERVARPQVRSGQRALLARDVTEVDGMLVTTKLRTALDLGRQWSATRALSGLDAMLRAGVDHDELLSEISRFAGERWIRTLRYVAPLASRLSASPPESAVKLAWYEATATLPDLQIEVTGPQGRPAFLDLGSRALRFAVEYDGVEWHSSPPTSRRMKPDGSTLPASTATTSRW